MYHIISSDSVTVVIKGRPYSVTSDHKRYDEIIAAIYDNDEQTVEDIIMAKDVLATLGTYGEVSVFGGHVTFKGEEVHSYLVDRILASKTNPDSLANFMNNVMKNPSRRAVQDLYSWCEKAKMPLTEDGHIIAYKIVNDDFKDCFSGKFDNSPGKIVEVERNQVDDNPDHTCSHGLHFCSSDYLPNYGNANKKVVLVKVSPADVVAFPTDYNLSKARCCRYEVLEEVDGQQTFTQDFYERTIAERFDDIAVQLGINEATLTDGLDAAEDVLNLFHESGSNFSARLDRIERELGL